MSLNYLQKLALGAAVLVVPATIAAQDAGAPADLLPTREIPTQLSAPVVQETTETVQSTFADVQNWSGPQLEALLGYIENIAAEGLNPADYEPEVLRAAMETGTAGEVNAAASTSFGWLVEDLRDGRTPMKARKQWFVVDPDADVMPTNALMARALLTNEVAGVLEGLNPTHPDYARLKTELATATDVKRVAKIRANMDRWRWLAHDLGPQYLITNVPEYQLRLTVNDKIIRTYKTIVGKPGRTATPQLAETVEGVVFNPTWTVPQSIVKGEGLGNKVLNNPTWARRAGYKATKGANGWISVVQQPGPSNSLGRMKLDMPNRHAIFLHDTPSRGLFNNKNRALSHGCIRTERALELAITVSILGGAANADEAVGISTSGKYTRVPVKKTMPVYITYFTMAQDINGKLSNFADIYGRDAPVLASFEKPREINRPRVTSEEAVEIIDDMKTT
ncbi:L,D-transpeptidase family protein [Altererythrobacter sp. ZODW24]|uniref:L,D-transpeptidase family protein n=1 Tax=Altererythrobacter sp. ZODW24 TaxID=2185142 RepID=UPI000DF77DFB|nr:L,D-transpeptidase family protein [Altererythrobacter sp. ZODW24]